MNTDFPHSEKVLENMIETLALLSPNDFGKLKDAIAEEVEKRDRQHLIELRENAVKALRDFFQAGGYLMNGINTYNSVPDIRFNDDEDCIYIR